MEWTWRGCSHIWISPQIQPFLSLPNAQFRDSPAKWLGMIASSWYLLLKRIPASPFHSVIFSTKYAITSPFGVVAWRVYLQCKVLEVKFWVTEFFIICIWCEIVNGRKRLSTLFWLLNSTPPLLYPRGSAAPLPGIAPIATLERFVLYCSCEQIISAAPAGAAQRARGIAQAVTNSNIMAFSWRPSYFKGIWNYLLNFQRNRNI